MRICIHCQSLYQAVYFLVKTEPCPARGGGFSYLDQPLTQSLVSKQAQDCLSQWPGLPGRYEKAVPFMDGIFPAAATVGADDGRAASHGLQRGQSEAFEHGGKDEDIGGAEDAPEVLIAR